MHWLLIVILVYGLLLGLTFTQVRQLDFHRRKKIIHSLLGPFTITLWAVTAFLDFLMEDEQLMDWVGKHQSRV